MWTTAFSTGSSERPAAEVGEEPVAEVGQRRWRVTSAAGAEVVDDVVGVPAERVERPDVVAFHRGSAQVDQ